MVKRAFLVLSALLFWTSAEANGPLRSVVVFGNEKTERQTVIGIINVPPQTYVNDRLLQEVDDRLTHSGLFKSVKIRATPNRDGTMDLRVTVVEKQLWFAFPIFQAWSGRYNGGVAFGESNLFIPNGRTLAVFQGGNKLSRGLLATEIKSLFNTDFVVRSWLMLRSDDVPLYTGETRTGEINLRDVSFSVRPGYQWTNDIQTAVSFNYAWVDYGTSPDPAVTPSDRKGNDFSVEFQFIYDSLKRREAFLKGRKLIASAQFADRRFGSDFTYHVQELSWQEAFPVFKYFNYVYEIEGRLGDESLPFHRQFTLGGASLRGFNDRQFRGDTQVTARQNLLFRVFRHPKFSVFGQGFYDFGLLYLDRGGFSRDSVHNGIGGGLRVSLSEILAPVFGFDAGYGIEDGAFRMYVAVGLVEF